MAKQNKETIKKSDKPANIVVDRTPIVTILGHVDHGKTTLLDKIRDANVQGGEVGGMTQKISVFTVSHERMSVKAGSLGKITFIDTPGHEAFDLMRARGGDIADIVLLIIAADDGIKPQTLESIEIIKRSKAKPIVVFNKVDLPNIDLDKIKRELAAKDIQVEGYGGSIPVVEVSGKTGKGIDTLLETISLLVDLEGLHPVPELPADAVGRIIVLESIKDPKKGYVSTIIVTTGQLKAGDTIVYRVGEEIRSEKVKGIISESNESIELINAGEGGRILGLSGLIELGEIIFATESTDKRQYKEFFVNEEPEKSIKEELAEITAEGTDPLNEEDKDALLASLFSVEDNAEEPGEEIKTLNVVIKASSEGALQAILKSLDKIDVEGAQIKITASGVGDITPGDIDMAEVTKSIILSFESTVDANAKNEARKRKILVREYQIIYKLIEELEIVLTSMVTPQETEEDLGEAEIREIFTLSDGTMVLGGRISKGILKKNAKCYVVRGDDIVAEGKITSLKHAKKDIVEAPKGTDFGAIISPTPKGTEKGDKIFCVKVVK